MQIRVERKSIQFVRTVYRRVEPILLQDGCVAYKAGTGRSIPEWTAKIPIDSESLPPEIAAALSEEERNQAERWFLDRANERRAKAVEDAMIKVAEIMAWAAEGYKRSGETGTGDRLTPDIASAIWKAWKPLRAELQRRGFQERDCGSPNSLPEILGEASSRTRHKKGGTNPEAAAASDTAGGMS